MKVRSRRKFKRGDLEWGGGGEHLVFTTSLGIFLAKPRGVHLSMAVGSNYYFFNIEGRRGSKILF